MVFRTHSTMYWVQYNRRARQIEQIVKQPIFLLREYRDEYIAARCGSE